MDTLAARQQMVDQQIRTWEVLDPRVLDVFSAVPREAFVPPEYRELAFADAPIPIGFGQSMLGAETAGPHFAGARRSRRRPRARSRLRHGLSVRVLEPARLLHCAIDIHPQFTAAAAANLRAVAGCAGAISRLRDAFDGRSLGEYDVIAVTGSLPVYDYAL